jgi:undecaprenyl-diphosphatase
MSQNVWSQVINSIVKWDTWLFLKINNYWISPVLDNVFPWWREANTWIPLYLFLFLFVLMNFGWRIWPWIVLVILTATITDQTSSTFFKEWINRTRPCNDEFLKYQVRLLLNRCPGSGSFTSSHATNHFGAAVLIYLTLKPVIKKWGYLLFIWAITVSYAQVYVGFHYPLDVIGGAVLGSLIGFIMAAIYKKTLGLPPTITQEMKKHQN